MGFDQGQIELDHADFVYKAGQIIHGKLVFHQEKKKCFRGLFIELRGYCDVRWTTMQYRRLVKHKSHEDYCEQEVVLVGGSEGEVHLNPGHHEFPFKLRIPEHCPSSFEGSNGHIRYELKAVLDRDLELVQEKKIWLTVINMKDLNVDPYCKEPMLFKFEETYCCWCMRSGTCEVSVRLPQSGCCPGQTISLDVSCSNNSNVEISIIQFKLVEYRKFTAAHNYDTRYEKEDIAKLCKGPIPANTIRNWNFEMEIPKFDLYNVDACQYIDITHSFGVKISPSRCHSDIDDCDRIVLGHIPLRGTSFNEGPPFEDVDPTINQPVHLGFPEANQFQQNAYLGPNNRSPFPQYQPFPTPGQNPSNPPYPGKPPGQSPHFSDPYPPGNPHGQTTHYTNYPYPSNPPYTTGPLPTVSPYPVGPDLPQSPVTPHVPYPLNPTGSPFKPSAPEPSTPDVDGNVHSIAINLEAKN